MKTTLRTLACPVWTLAVALLGLSLTATAASDFDLAQRFRPFIKTSLDGAGEQEQFRQTSWQWFVKNSTLKNGDQTIVEATKWVSANDLPTKGYDLTVTGETKNPELTLLLSDDAIHGEDWQSVISGDGTYAHVERIGTKPAGVDNRLVNIDYTMIWSYNSARDKWIFQDVDHIGDLTFLVVLYDPISDRVVRLTYPAHGCILQLYQLIPGQPVTVDSVPGQDLVSKNAINAANVHIEQSNEADETDGNCSKWGGFLSSDNDVYFAPDPDSGRYEHPLVFVENGTHESFPNPAGRITNGGDHGGMGTSWLPGTVTLLPAFNDVSDLTNAPFLRFNGKFGNDSATLVRHTTWCWPTLDRTSTPDPPAPCVYSTASTTVPIDGSSDMQPYQKRGGLVWPQVVSVAVSGDAYAVADRRKGDGSSSQPFGGLDVAATFMPAGWTLHLGPGQYSAPKLDRPMTLEAHGGTVTIGSQ